MGALRETPFHAFPVRSNAVTQNSRLSLNVYNSSSLSSETYWTYLISHPMEINDYSQK